MGDLVRSYSSNNFLRAWAQHAACMMRGVLTPGGVDLPRQRLVSAKSIGLDHAMERDEMIARPFTFAIRAELVIGGRRPASRPRPLIHQVNPNPPSPGFAVAGSQNLNRR